MMPPTKFCPADPADSEPGATVSRNGATTLFLTVLHFLLVSAAHEGPSKYRLSGVPVMKVRR